MFVLGSVGSAAFNPCGSLVGPEGAADDKVLEVGAAEELIQDVASLCNEEITEEGAKLELAS